MDSTATGTKLIPGQLKGIDGATVPISELAQLAREAGCTLVLGELKEPHERNFADLFDELVWGRIERIYQQCRASTPRLYEAYQLSRDRLKTFLKDRLNDADLDAYRDLYNSIEDEAIAPWEGLYHEALYLGGFRDGLRLAQLLKCGEEER